MRLIDADELKKKFQERSYWTYTHEYGDAIPIGWIMSGIDNAPTVVNKNSTTNRPQVNVIPQECIKVLAETVTDVVQQIDWKALCEKVAERPHGYWVNCEDPHYLGNGYTECSNCKMRFAFGAYHEAYDFKYCPECGADMRGEDHD